MQLLHKGEGLEMKSKLVAALLAGCAVSMPAAAYAQDVPDADQPVSMEPESAESAASIDNAEAKIEMLEAQVQALEASINQIKASLGKATPSWKGAPQYDEKEAGFS